MPGNSFGSTRVGEVSKFSASQVSKHVTAARHDVGGGSREVSKWNLNTIVCCGLTLFLISAGIFVATWYTVVELNNTNSTM